MAQIPKEKSPSGDSTFLKFYIVTAYKSESVRLLLEYALGKIINNIDPASLLTWNGNYWAKF